MPTAKSRKKTNTFSSLDEDFDSSPSQDQESNDSSSNKDPPSDSDLLRELCSKLNGFTISMEKLGQDFTDFKNESSSRTQNLEDRFDAFINGKPPPTQNDASDPSQQSAAGAAPTVSPRDGSPSADASNTPSQSDGSRQRNTPSTHSTNFYGNNTAHNSFPQNSSGTGPRNYSTSAPAGNNPFVQPSVAPPNAFNPTAAHAHFANLNQSSPSNPFGASGPTATANNSFNPAPPVPPIPTGPPPVRNFQQNNFHLPTGYVVFDRITWTNATKHSKFSSERFEVVKA